MTDTTPTPGESATNTADRLAIAATAIDLAAMRLGEAAEALDGVGGMGGVCKTARGTISDFREAAVALRDHARTLREAAGPSATTGARA